jgi:hypothetical protein
MPLSLHALTNIEVLKLFLPVQVQLTTTDSGAVLVKVNSS